jgi:hydrogenase maturation protease
MLILGVGNEFRGDDAVGLRIARRLREVLPQVRIRESNGNLSELVDCLSSEDEVIVIDAVCSGAACGTIHRLNPQNESLPLECFRGSTHAFGVAEAVELCRSMGQLPARILVYGIEGTNFAIGSAMSSGVAQAIHEVTAEIAEEATTHA